MDFSLIAELGELAREHVNVNSVELFYYQPTHSIQVVVHAGARNFGYTLHDSFKD